METKTDSSYGVVPLFKKDGEWQVLLVHQISYRGDDFWIFPKGHAEEKETGERAALRELEEETGVIECTLDTTVVFPVQYSFTHEELRINKTVEYWIGYCESQHTYITHPQEIKELQWCNFISAEELLSHQNSKDVLEKVQHYLDSE